MSDKIKLQVTQRSLTGRKIKKLRQKGILPANIYGKDIKSLSIELPLKDFKAAFAQAGETSIIELLVDKETKPRPVLIHNVHLHPVTDAFLHADFHQVDLTKKVTVNIPIELKGEAPAVSKGGVLLQLIDEVEVEALPTDLPDKFELEVSKLEEIGQSISLKELKLSDKVKLMIENLDELVVKIEEPTKEEEKPEIKPEEGEAALAEGEEVEAKEGEVPAKEGDQPEAKPGLPKGGKAEETKPTDKPQAKPEAKKEPKAEKK
jgi:large subunit ribosomal protein L25